MHWTITSESIRTAHGTYYRRKPLRIPMPPFPGLGIGAMVVKRVCVNQGAVNDEIEVEYEPWMLKGHIKLLEEQGWEPLE